MNHFIDLILTFVNNKITKQYFVLKSKEIKKKSKQPGYYTFNQHKKSVFFSLLLSLLLTKRFHQLTHTKTSQSCQKLHDKIKLHHTTSSIQTSIFNINTVSDKISSSIYIFSSICIRMLYKKKRDNV